MIFFSVSLSSLSRALRRTNPRAALAIFLLTFRLFVPCALMAQATGGPQSLNIEVIEGEGALNNVRLRTARETIVEVQDENHKPVAGALVTFAAKGGNPFQRGILRATTDATGRVHANPLQLRSTAGRLNMQVKASYMGRTATQTIHQVNALQTPNQASSTGANTSGGVTATPAKGPLPLATTLTIVGVLAGATIGGLYAGGVLGGGGGKTAQISIGTPHF